MHAAEWQQYNIDFRDHKTAEQVAAHDLLPVLEAAQRAGLLTGWWFLRKQPWRLRYLRGSLANATMPDLLTTLKADQRIAGWVRGVYEPEAHAFGGEEGMDVAHALFHRDSRFLLRRFAQPAPTAFGQRETTMLLCGAMLRAAHLDRFEQGDVWSRVLNLRSDLATAATGRVTPELVDKTNQFLMADSRAALGRGAVAEYAEWRAAFEQAGRALLDLSLTGRLRRGLRDVLAHHIIFHANRAGLTVLDQATLAILATDAVFLPERHVVSTSSAPRPTTKVPRVTTLSNDPQPDQLRRDLADRLSRLSVIRTPSVESAFRQVPRHLFLPGSNASEAYADTPVYTKHDKAGTSVSAASQPWIVATMLEQLAAQPGERILEIGAGTGYNAALMGAIVGDGHITTIDVDQDLVDGARAHLRAAGVTNVDVICADGALGHPDGAPYDRIIATVGAYEVPTALLDQLSPTGRLVVPLRLRGTNSRSITFERDADRWVSRDSQLAVFMPLRGVGADARRIIPLNSQQDVTLQVHKDQIVDGQALAGVLDADRDEQWTGVLFPPNTPYEWVELWLCVRLKNALMRMNTKPEAADRGQVIPMFPWGSMATVDGASIAYLTTRAATPGDDGGKRYEIGVMGQGPAGKILAQRVAEEIQIWDQEYRSRSVRFEMPDVPDMRTPAAGCYVLGRARRPITVIWE